VLPNQEQQALPAPPKQGQAPPVLPERGQAPLALLEQVRKLQAQQVPQVQQALVPQQAPRLRQG
jgi:hypothetical protein